jgi:colanic acid/amylovoran biosynthesis protein
VIGWSHKYREVLDMFGLADWALGHDAYTDEVFAERIRALDEVRDAVRTQIAEALPQVTRTALEQIDVIERVARR